MCSKLGCSSLPCLAHMHAQVDGRSTSGPRRPWSRLQRHHEPDCPAWFVLSSPHVDTEAKPKALAASVLKTVEGVVQVVGLHNVPTTPPNTPSLRQWYFDVSCTLPDKPPDDALPLMQNSIVVVPSNHPIFHDSKTMKKHGQVFRIGEHSPVPST